MQRLATASFLTLGLGIWGCSGGGYSSGNSGSPAAPTPVTNGVVTINVVAINGAQSFSPNPATLPAGQMVVWHNLNNATHRAVMRESANGIGTTTVGGTRRPRRASHRDDR